MVANDQEKIKIAREYFTRADQGRADVLELFHEDAEIYFLKLGFRHVRPSSLLKRFAIVDEVAAIATHVAGQLSSTTNGAALRVDGGVVRAIL
jgi:hypothetical protein